MADRERIEDRLARLRAATELIAPSAVLLDRILERLMRDAGPSPIVIALLTLGKRSMWVAAAAAVVVVVLAFWSDEQLKAALALINILDAPL